MRFGRIVCVTGFLAAVVLPLGTGNPPARAERLSLRTARQLAALMSIMPLSSVNRGQVQVAFDGCSLRVWSAPAGRLLRHPPTNPWRITKELQLPLSPPAEARCGKSRLTRSSLRELLSTGDPSQPADGVLEAENLLLGALLLGKKSGLRPKETMWAVRRRMGGATGVEVVEVVTQRPFPREPTRRLFVADPKSGWADQLSAFYAGQPIIPYIPAGDLASELRAEASVAPGQVSARTLRR